MPVRNISGMVLQYAGGLTVMLKILGSAMKMMSRPIYEAFWSVLCVGARSICVAVPD